MLRGELERVAVAARDERRTAALFFRSRGRGEEIVGLVAGTLGVRETEGCNELRQRVELIDQRVVELAPALVVGERRVAIGLRFQRVPCHEHRARLLREIEPQQEIREADDGARLLAAASQDRLRQRVIGAVGEIIAVDHQQRPVAGLRRLRLSLSPSQRAEIFSAPSFDPSR